MTLEWLDENANFMMLVSCCLMVDSDNIVIIFCIYFVRVSKAKGIIYTIKWNLDVFNNKKKTTQNNIDQTLWKKQVARNIATSLWIVSIAALNFN